MIPLATTTVRVERDEQHGLVDPYETPASDPTTITERWPAHISSPSGTDQRIGGDKEIVTAVLLVAAEPALERIDRIVDESTGERYSVTWVRRRTGLGLDHQRAGLVAIKGGANG